MFLRLRTACFVAIATFACSIVASASTVAYYRFEEGNAGATAAGSGSIVDSSSNGLNGTPSGGPEYSSNRPSTPFVNGLAMDFGGVSQMVGIPDYPQLRLTSSLTVEAYVNVREVRAGYGQYIVIRGDDRNSLDPYTLQVQIVGNNPPQYTFGVTNSSDSAAAVGAPIPGMNEWHHVAGVLDDGTNELRIYVDGTLQASASANGVRPFETLDAGQTPGLGIGNVPDPNYPRVSIFNGLIDEVRISDEALAPGQLLSNVPEPGALSAVMMVLWIARRRGSRSGAVGVIGG